jgi:phosphonate metabolism protein PhnN/1,5-bisphosphokinase (PRPP-forming)
MSATAHGAGPGAGRLVAIVGASGSGKDSLIGWLKSRLADRPEVMFVRRTVTRAANAAFEDHDTLAADDFARAEKEGSFAVVWQAHGLKYGLPVEALRHVQSGGIAICNGSRNALVEIGRVFGKLQIFELRVDPAILAARLRARGRETDAEIENRIARGSMCSPPLFNPVIVDNSTTIDIAGEATLAQLGIQ